MDMIIFKLILNNTILPRLEINKVRYFAYFFKNALKTYHFAPEMHPKCTRNAQCHKITALYLRGLSGFVLKYMYVRCKSALFFNFFHMRVRTHAYISIHVYILPCAKSYIFLHFCTLNKKNTYLRRFIKKSGCKVGAKWVQSGCKVGAKMHPEKLMFSL